MNGTKKFVTILLAAITVGGAGLFAGCKKDTSETVSIVKSGLSDYSIVIPAEATACEQFSAEELRDFVKQSTGVTLPVVSENSAEYSSDGKKISIGNTSLLEQSGLGMQEGLRSDAYSLTSSGNSIFIYGNSDRANLYGAYEFLEEYVGVRFLTADYTYVPEKDSVDVQMPMNIVKNPAFDQRQYWSMDAQTNALYAARKRVVTYWNWSMPQYGYGMYRDFEAQGHNVLRLLQAGAESFGLASIPDNAYATDLAGNRMSTDFNGESIYDVCWTDGLAEDGSFIDEVQKAEDGTPMPTAAQCLYEGLKKSLKSNTTATIFCIMQEDTPAVVCDCETCHKNKENYGAVSANIVRMINALALKINEYNRSSEGDGRDIRLATYAYAYSQEAPVLYRNGAYEVYDNSVIPNEKVIVEYCTMNNCNHTLSINDSRQDSFHKDNLKKWEWLCETNKNLAIYTYTSNFNCALTYNPNLKTLKENIIYIYENLNRDMVTFENAVYTGDWQQQLRMYVASKLFWDPYAEVQPLIDEFISLTYGRSAKAVRNYIERMEAQCDYNRSVYGSEFYLIVADHTDYMIHNSKFWKLGALETSVKELKEEIAAVSADETLSQSEKDRLTKELKKVLISPMMQIKFHYDEYYGLAGNKDEFTAELKQLISEFAGMNNQATKYGLV